MQQTVEEILAAIKNGRHAEALEASRRLAQSFPSDEGVRSLLAVCEQNGGDMHQARDILIALTRDHSGTWQHWNNLGNVERLLGNLTAAGIAYANALEIHAGSARLRANLGLLHLNLGNFAQAREQLCMAVSMEGAEHGMRIWAAVACQASADDAAARNLISGWQQWPPVSEEATLELGWLLTLLGDFEAGELILSSEFQDSTLRMRGLARRVLGLERVNRIDEAIELTKRMMDPNQIADRQARMETLQALATVAMRRKDAATAQKCLELALALDQPQRYKRSLYFALAKACDSLGDVDATMMALDHAHASDISAPLENERKNFDGTGLIALADSSFSLSAPISNEKDAVPSAKDSPVFIVGFPRSGTTLLEQMLSAHEDFTSADEQPMLQRVLGVLREQGDVYPHRLSEISEARRIELRDQYWDEARKSVTLSPGIRLIDKHPLNFLALPLIHFLFPNAPVIFCRRHPCDSLLSSYMQDFRDPRLATECSTIERLASLYAQLHQRWAADSQWIPQEILICRHEDLITETDRELRRVGEFLGVNDVSAMHHYQAHAKSRGFIGTPSYSQVVEGINPEASGRWLRYSKVLAPILPALAPIIEDWGYEA